MKLTRKEKIAKIYKIIADKTLSYGCRLLDPRGIFVERKNKKKTAFTYYDEIGSSTRHDTARIKYRRCEIFNHWKSIENKIKKIWHPIMIWDILDFIIYDQWLYADRYILLWKWRDEDEPIRTELRKPIEEQNDDCVDFVYDLIAEYTSF